ncbi:hypothetical protein CCAX7_002370 [Capsulimonas corticalis]|uniref:Uncharacterized protein n=1 Tax=Capsulimonas corticalis TaxID=2219043 RepID=A0A402CS38_9BACT|nr:hypothetical protein [Capsulimonas corticalis]BDI28186.1 hypothetical protein CCAX7_002370 [Capsulimonas corticalis]
MKISNERKRRIVQTLIQLFSLAAALCLGLWGWMDLSYTKSGYLDFILHKNQYEQMVAHAKQSGVPPGGSNRFAPPQQLSKKATIRDDYSGYITTTRDLSGHYTITIITSDKHHGGVFGYVYSDLTVKPAEETETTAPFQRLSPTLDTHWWIAEGDE